MLLNTDFKVTFKVSVCLYLIGLGGDSWYGIMGHVPLLNKLYVFIFNWMEYTRSALFFAPLFLCSGALIYRHQKLIERLKRINMLFGIFLSGMIFESIVLHKLAITKHDSMYLLLPFNMLCLFVLLLKWEPKIKNGAKLVYILHPIIIAVIHPMINHVLIFRISILNYILVLLSSFVLSYIVLKVKDKIWVKDVKKECK